MIMIMVVMVIVGSNGINDTDNSNDDGDASDVDDTTVDHKINSNNKCDQYDKKKIIMIIKVVIH